MIPCGKCGHDNPLGTAFCHSCGARLEVKTEHIMQSVQATEQAKRERRLLDASRGAVSFAMFLLVCALVLDLGLAPALPPPRIPDAAPITVIDPATPGWAAAPATTAVAPPPALGARPGRLDLRRLRGATVAQALAIDPAALAAMRQPLMATVRDDGGCAGGGDPLATAGLVALALQAWPDDAAAAAAAKVRGWLAAHARDATHATGLPRALAIAALIDGEALDPAIRGALGNRVVDGSAPAWQMLALPLLPADQRPTELVALRTARDDATWATLLALAAGEASPRAAEACGATTTPATGEERLLWAFAAWQLGRAPDVVAQRLKDWSGQPPAPIDAALTTACGPIAPAAVLLLTIAAPLRLPPVLLLK